MTKGSKSGVSSGASGSKAMVEEKGKRYQFCTRIGIDLDPRTMKLHSQADVDEYLAKYGVSSSPKIKVEFSLGHRVREVSVQ